MGGLISFFNIRVFLTIIVPQFLLSGYFTEKSGFMLAGLFRVSEMNGVCLKIGKNISEAGMGSKELDRLIILKWDNRGQNVWTIMI